MFARSAPSSALVRRSSRGVARTSRARASAVVRPVAELEALLFDCDGVILESEGLHLRAYNAAFEHFELKNADSSTVFWSEEYYDYLSNTVGGGKPKMRLHFGNTEWPRSTILPKVPESDDEKTKIIDEVQEWKTNHYKELIGSGAVPARPGVLELMDAAKDAGLKIGVCSASTKEAAVFVVQAMLGAERFAKLDVFLAGNDVANLKPDPEIYLTGAKTIGIDPANCLVVEDTETGKEAAVAAKMRCIVTYTRSGEKCAFEGAEMVVEDIVKGAVTIDLLKAGPPAQVVDDRVVNA
mmetsp:Transcript_12807/g.42273  ORF Transcript_12807/g.42273 Transcript_12807/m.42273 type:complete len:296 (-) Transcript_12807:38-925(-)